MWTDVYEDLLVEWTNLREYTKTLPLEDALHLIHDWWQQAPIISGHAHINNPDNWPPPWELLAKNAFCELDKCLGMCYTILLVEHEDINSFQLVQTDNYNLVIINDGQYVLNGQFGEITADLSNLRIRVSVDSEFLRNKLK